MNRPAPPNVVLTGPPGSGKTTAGRALAERLQRPFVDTDQLIEERSGQSVAAFFALRGERAFRQVEAQVCQEFATKAGWVVACGGGALLNEQTRQRFEGSSIVICLRCELSELRRRLSHDVYRPLLGPDPTGTLGRLLEARKALYDSVPLQFDTTHKSPDQVAEHLANLVDLRQQQKLRIRQDTGTAVHLGPGLLSKIEKLAAMSSLSAPYVTVADANVASLYGRAISSRLGGPLIEIPAGERAKTLDNVRACYGQFIAAGMERSGTVVALGGGVVSDLAGFAAATFMRGVRWIAVPTTLVGMVDASIGGKVGVDLQQGKNLVGAFHPPALVVADTDTLATLPEQEIACGLAEVVKAAVIGDRALFELIEGSDAQLNLSWIMTALRVKAQIVETDPREAGERAVLNFGHTIGHGLELASGYRMSHGQAVAIGMVAETIISEKLNLAEAGLADRLSIMLRRLGLPTTYSGITPKRLRRSIRMDKKRRAGELLFSLPVALGEVRHGIQVPESELMTALKATWVAR